MCRIDAGTIDDAQLLRDAQGAGSAAKAHHFLNRPSRLQGQGEGAANQAGTENNNLAEFRLAAVHLLRSRQNPLKRLDEAGVFLRRTDGHPQPVR